MKSPLTLSGIEPATFRFVAQHLNHCATAVPKNYIEDIILMSRLSDERFTNYFRLHKGRLIRGDLLDAGCNAQKTVETKNNVALHFIRQKGASRTMWPGAEQNQKLVPRTKPGLCL